MLRLNNVYSKTLLDLLRLQNEVCQISSSSRVDHEETAGHGEIASAEKHSTVLDMVSCTPRITHLHCPAISLLPHPSSLLISPSPPPPCSVSSISSKVPRISGSIVRQPELCSPCICSAQNAHPPLTFEFVLSQRSVPIVKFKDW